MRAHLRHIPRLLSRNEILFFCGASGFWILVLMRSQLSSSASYFLASALLVSLLLTEWEPPLAWRWMRQRAFLPFSYFLFFVAVSIDFASDYFVLFLGAIHLMRMPCPNSRSLRLGILALSVILAGTVRFIPALALLSALAIIDWFSVRIANKRGFRDLSLLEPLVYFVLCFAARGIESRLEDLFAVMLSV